RAPHEKRQPRCEIDIRQAIHSVRRTHGLLGPEHESRIRQDALDAEADAVLEVAAALARAIVDREELVDVVAHRTAIRLCGEPAQDLAGTPALLARRGRVAGKNLSPARGLGHARHAEWS